jgi:hypothetical protein
MFPKDFPPGTTARTLVTAIFPSEHERLVPRDAGAAEASLHIEGGPSFAFRVEGNRLDVTCLPAPPGGRTKGKPDVPNAPLSVTVHAATLERFLADWMVEKRYLPRFPPQGDVKLLSDPRLLRRLALVGARIEIALTDFEGGRASLTLDAGARGRRPDADAVIEATTETFESLLAGSLAPDEAVIEGHVEVRGSKLAAMKLALAFAPYFPPRA